ncbi:MAG: FAD/NAD(P)-binding protein [Gammaproteobacteria bacterium]|nr:FAD/NAD(P)-binding protein [Gammaproteobacteria bacterium]
MERHYTIAIIGGGATGVCLANKIVEALPVGLSTATVSLALFDARGCTGGAAYAPDVASNLMNTTCGAVDRAFGGEFGILDWARDNPAKWQPYVGDGQLDTTTYLPRPVVGSYLSDLVEHATRKAAERGMRLEVIIDEVVDIAPPDAAEGDYVVQTKSGRVVEARYVYLALGHLDRAKTDAYQDHDRYYHQPYPIARLTREIPKEATVGVIGTRLSAIDVVLGLVGEGHKGRIHCVSRGGRLPAVRGDHGRYEFRHLERDELVKKLVHTKAKLRLVDVAVMLGTEIEHAAGRPVDLGAIMSEDLPPAEYYEREIALAKGKARPWQTVLYATNRNIDLLWHHLEEEDKQILASQWLNDWLTYRASIPRENAERILALLRSGQLTVAGGVTGFRFDAATGNLRASFDDGSRIDCRYLVAATGSASRIEDADSLLMRNLLANGLVVPHRFGGVDCVFETGQVVSRPGVVAGEPRIFALGPLTSGVYFFTTALEIVERQAVQRTRDLAFLLGDEWLELPETDAWVDAQQGKGTATGPAETAPSDRGPDLLAQAVRGDQAQLIDFEQLRLLNDQIDRDAFKAADATGSD